MIRKLTLALLGATMLVSPALAADPAPVPASALVKEISIPHRAVHAEKRPARYRPYRPQSSRGCGVDLV